MNNSQKGQIKNLKLISYKALIFFFLLLTGYVIQGQALNSEIIFSTYIGNKGTEDADVVAVDPLGNTYLGCHATSGNLTGSEQHSYKIMGGMDAFVIKINNDSGDIDYIAHMGGKEWEAIQGIVSDTEGNIYAVGTTYSSDFPIHKDGFQSTFGGESDAFVIKLDTEGKVIWSTFLGGSEDEDGRSIVIDSIGNIHVVGRTASTNFPVTAKAIQPKSAGGIDAFVTTLDTNGKMLMSTYLGGKGDDIGFSIDYDNTELYIAGTTSSTDFPVKNAIQAENKGGDDAFIAVINPAKSAIEFASYLGGKENERLYNVNFNTTGDVFMMGFTYSSDFPTTKSAFQTNLKGGRDIFFSRLDLRKQRLSYATFLGGDKDESPRNLTVSKDGTAYITGFTSSMNFPTTSKKEKKLNGEEDAFISIFNSNGTSLLFSDIFGGEGKDFFEGIALGQDGSITVSGGSNSPNYPIVKPIQDSFLGGRFDMIVTRFILQNIKE